VWLAVVALAAVNPARVRRLVGPPSAGAVAAGAAVDDRSGMAEGAVAAGTAGSGLAVGAVATGAAASALAVGAVAVIAGPLLRAADVSPSTALVAAGLVVALAAVVDAVARRPAPLARWGPGGGALVPLAVPALVRPAVTVLAVAVAADGGLVAGIAVAIAVAAAGASVLLPLPGASPSPLPREQGEAAAGDEPRAGDRRRLLAGDAATWAFAAVALLGAVDLVAHGVFSV
jgi:hypothetical protein